MMANLKRETPMQADSPVNVKPGPGLRKYDRENIIPAAEREVWSPGSIGTSVAGSGSRSGLLP
jgi:hypothetical protein